jgi:hypothetical protein
VAGFSAFPIAQLPKKERERKMPATSRKGMIGFVSFVKNYFTTIIVNPQRYQGFSCSYRRLIHRRYRKIICRKDERGCRRTIKTKVEVQIFALICSSGVDNNPHALYFYNVAERAAY